MESISKKIRLYRSFGTLKYQDMESNSQEWATDEGINNCLIEVFKNEAHIIHPNLSSILSPVDTENILGVLNYIETLQKIIIQDGGELRKPVIAIWHSTETQSFVGAHWQTLVILPKYYITFDQRPLENPNELIFFKDPYYEGKSIPKAFKNLLNNRISFNNILGEDQQNEEVKMGGIMPNAEFYDTKYINVKQQKDESSCGWWAVYNAIMFVMTGSDDFIRQFSSIAEDLSNPLRYIFESFKLRLNPKSETVQKEMNKKDQNPMNQEFQNFSDTLNFELYSVLSGINNTETAIKFQINSKKDLLYCASPDSFKVLVTSDIHVDKTLFIKEIIDSGSSNNILITRPRRWGKTLNLDMLKSFFEIDIDEKGNFELEKTNKNRELFEGSISPIDLSEKRSLRKLNIAEVNNGKYLSYQGKYPVIFITFSSVRKDLDNPQDIFKGIRSSIARAFYDHIYVLNGLKIKLTNKINKLIEDNSNMPNQEIEDLIKIYTNEEKKDIFEFSQYLDKSSKENLDTSIFFLSRILNSYFKKEVYILVDEYDAPLNSSFGDDYYEQIKNLMKVIIGTSTKNNPYLKKAIITGILKISKSNLFSGLNNITDHGVLSSMYSEFFGFTDEEVNKLLNYCLIAKEPERELQHKYIKMCYNSYKIGDTIIYNPWSIMMCLQKASYQPLDALKCYWAYTGDFSMIKKAFSSLANIEELKPLIKNYKIECPISELVDLNCIGENSEDFLSLLLQSGYLTKAEIGKYKIPNLEVLSYFYHSILPIWIEKNIGLKKSINKLVQSAVNSIENGEIYKQVIQDELLVLIGHSERTEFDFQILLGAPSFLAFETKIMNHAVYSEVYTINQKKIDTLFLPIKGKSKIVIIHEYKKAPNDGAGINEVLEEAVWQIYANQYISKPILDRNMNKENYYWESIIVRAIAFFKKRDGLWGVEIKEFVHSFSQAEKVNQIFSNHNTNELLSKKSIAVASNNRKLFLLKNRAENISELICKYTGEEIHEDLKKKVPKIEFKDESILRIEREKII